MGRLLLFLVFVILLVVSVLLLELFDISIPDFPLGDLASKVVGDGWAGSCSSFLDGGVDSLDLSVLVVEFVLHGLFDGFNIFAGPGFLLLSLALDSFKFAFAGILNFLLNFVFVRPGMDIVSLEAKVHHQLINGIVDFILPFQIIIVDSVGLCLRVRYDQRASDCEVELCSGKSVDFCDFLNKLECTWFSSSYYSLTTLTSLGWMISGLWTLRCCMRYDVRSV
jgi:hypothetical protein